MKCIIRVYYRYNSLIRFTASSFRAPYTPSESDFRSVCYDPPFLRQLHPYVTDSKWGLDSVIMSAIVACVDGGRRLSFYAYRYYYDVIPRVKTYTFS